MDFFINNLLERTKHSRLMVWHVEFLMNAQAYVVHFQFSMNLNHKQCSNTIVAVTKITRRITMHKTQEIILGKPFSTKGKTQQSFATESREDHPYTINPSAHKRVLYDQER
jgi:RNase H-fold protein (predicted Holliday junction resolvase)